MSHVPVDFLSMAKIVHSDTAPSGTVHYVFAGVEFDISGRKNYETDDPSILLNAEAHPWLRVEREVVEPIQGAYVEQISPKDDSMSAMNSIANDPDEARKAEEAKMEDVAQPVAIESGLDQSEVVVIENADAPDTAETIAAAKDAGKKS